MWFSVLTYKHFFLLVLDPLQGKGRRSHGWASMYGRVPGIRVSKRSVPEIVVTESKADEVYSMFLGFYNLSAVNF
jgi:hypothetical protein